MDSKELVLANAGDDEAELIMRTIAGRSLVYFLLCRPLIDLSITQFVSYISINVFFFAREYKSNELFEFDFLFRV